MTEAPFEWRLPSPPPFRRLAFAAVVVIVLFFGVRAGIRGYAFASQDLTRGDVLYRVRRAEEWRRLSGMEVATQRAFFLLKLSRRRMDEALLAMNRRDRPRSWLIDIASAADRRLVPLDDSIAAGLVLEAERTFAHALTYYADVRVWGDALIENARSARNVLRDQRKDLRWWLEEHNDPALKNVLDQADDADAFYEAAFIRAREKKIPPEVRWLDPIAVRGEGLNSDILLWEARMRLLRPAFPEGVVR